MQDSAPMALGRLDAVTDLFRKEASTVACSCCKHVFRTAAGVSVDLGNVQDYESTHRPVSGWIRCDRCRTSEQLLVASDLWRRTPEAKKPSRKPQRRKRVRR